MRFQHDLDAVVLFIQEQDISFERFIKPYAALDCDRRLQAHFRDSFEAKPFEPTGFSVDQIGAFFFAQPQFRGARFQFYLAGADRHFNPRRASPTRRAASSPNRATNLATARPRAEDFVGMDMARKFLQMGYTQSRRYAQAS